jgi:putative ABC transport system permease protein
VAVEVAIALVLLVGAGLLLRSFSALSSVDTGIDLHNLLTFSVAAPGGRGTPAPRQVAFYDRLLERVESLPGVARAGAAVTLPIGGDDFSTGYFVEGQPLPPAGQESSAGWQIVSRGYFEAIGMHMLSGRGFRAGDTTASTPIAIVNETLARQAWPSADPVGRRVRLGRDADDPWLIVVGVVSDMRHRGPASPPRPEIYQPVTQHAFSSMAVVVRTTADPLSIVPLIRAEVSALDPSLPISHVSTMEEHVERALSRPRFMSTLTMTFGALAVVLALVGVYGVMAASVAQRTREIAIRIAVGARASDVVRMVALRAAVLTGAGVAAGLMGAWASSRVLAGLLFGVTANDGPTYLVSAAALLAVALAAAAVPAFRAARIDGSQVLRS